jgi:hypothetical protein
MVNSYVIVIPSLGKKSKVECNDDSPRYVYIVYVLTYICIRTYTHNGRREVSRRRGDMYESKCFLGPDSAQ